MAVLRSLCIALSCFSRIPVPHVSWDEQGMRYMLCFFPLVGVAVALCWELWLLVCDAAGLGMLLRAVGLTLVPVAVSGGIHMDGFADTVDAQASHAQPDRKRQILKDPHSGAFAAIGIAAYLLAYCALMAELSPAFGAGATTVALLTVPVLVRTLSGFATTLIPKADGSQMVAAFQESLAKRAVLGALTAWLALCMACLAYAGAVAVAAGAAAAAVCFAAFYAFQETQFGGMSGDLAGFFLQVTELVLLAVVVVLGKAVLC